MVGERSSGSSRRIAVVGTSGSGKSIVAARLAARLEVPHVELDGFRHQAGWVELPDEEFRARVAAAVAGHGWVVDGNYHEVRDLYMDRATEVVWLDLPRSDQPHADLEWGGHRHGGKPTPEVRFWACRTLRGESSTTPMRTSWRRRTGCGSTPTRGSGTGWSRCG